MKQAQISYPAKEFLSELQAAVSGEVRFDSSSRALYATDASNYRQIPIGLVVPRSVEDILATVAVARRHGVPLLVRGGGTSLAGQACNTAVVLDTSKYLNQIERIDPDSRTADVQPGAVCNVLRRAAEQQGLTFGPDPATHARCTLGGMVGNNSCGAHSVMAGKTAENVETLDILTYDGLRMTVGPTPEHELEAIIREGGRKGEIYGRLRDLRDQYADAVRRGFPQIRRRVSGYNLDALLPENGFNVAQALVGTEGTCAITLGARVRLIENPAHRVLLVFGFEDICIAGDVSPLIMETAPLCIEGLDEHIIGDMRKKGFGIDAIELLPAGNAWLMVEYGGATPEQAAERAREAAARLRNRYVASHLFEAPAEQAAVWSIRESGSAATNSVPGEPESYPGWEDAAVDPAHVGDYLRDYRKLLAAYGYKSSLYGHFGDGCIHGRVTFDLRSHEGVAKWRRFMVEAADLVVGYGGSLSGEHGDGQARAELLPRMFGPELMNAFREFKRIWDPDNRMNPGKVIDAYRMDENLRTGPEYRPLAPATYFAFPRDEGSFANAAGRCVGVAKCRRHAGGTMCPSYRATGEERHSTRGRARLLFEMLQGSDSRQVWNDHGVREALDLCLSCKGCRHECPVQVDMASYKAEFLYHYHQYNRRERQAWSMGRLHRWLPFASPMAGIVNLAARTSGLSSLGKRIAGLATQRDIPRLSSKAFTRRFRPRREAGRLGEVMLWPDTFNNYLRSDTALAAAEFLEQAGFRVHLPRGRVCCGRTLYDFGLLDQARMELERTLSAIEPAMERDIPVVGLEPACIGTFKDELLNLFPGDPRAQWLSRNSYLLAEYLHAHPEFEPPALRGGATLHGHCHQKALFGSGHGLLQSMGLEVNTQDTGCCGMAGSFGFHPEKYAVSLAVANNAFLPAISACSEGDFLVMDGYSCREQAEQLTGRRTLHTAELLRMAQRSGKGD